MTAVDAELSTAPTFSKSARGRLTTKDLGRFPGETLFDRIGRAVCGAGCLPRRELYEAWEMARRVRRRFRGGRVVDLAGGHGVLAQILLLLDDTSPTAVVVDPVIPASAPRVQAALCEVWPRIDGRVTFVCGDLHATAVASSDLVVSCHACGGLTDLVLDRAVAAGARVAALPCCHDLGSGAADALRGWLDGPLSIDVGRVTRLGEAGYRVWTQTIPAEITEKNRLLMAAPMAGALLGEGG
jgi:hypothetical protein